MPKVLTRVQMVKAGFDPDVARLQKVPLSLRIQVLDNSPKGRIELEVTITRRRTDRGYWSGKTQHGTTFRIRPYDGWEAWQRLVEFDCTPEELRDQAAEKLLDRVFGKRPEEEEAELAARAKMQTGLKIQAGGGSSRRISRNTLRRIKNGPRH